jgi:prepilin signal peptidase PulO-like enzyme (type II secretory pathway)
MILFLNVFIIFCIFVIGALFGSFFSLATYRIPRKQDIIATRSYCPNCKHRLEFFDLIPILSYIFCFGKCRYCKEKISIRYLLLEVINGFMFVILFFAMYKLFGYNIYCLIATLIIGIIYAVIFVLIGSKIMDKNMENEKKKINRKKGVFISELVIAMILLTILLSTSYIVSRNYSKKSVVTISRGNAVSIAVKNIELCLSTDYDSLNSFVTTESIDNVVYNSTVQVVKYSDENSLKQDLVKKINIVVEYNVLGVNYEFSLSTLKGKVL